MNSAAALPDYQVLAIRYATAVRPAADFYLHADPHEGPGRIDYFVWLIRGEGRAILVDTGFSAAAAAARGRTFLRCPTTALTTLGVKTEEVQDVIVTHLHYDHAGNLGLFPNAVFRLQDQEMAGATGRDMSHPVCRRAFNLPDVLAMVEHVWAERVRFVDGMCEIGPGLSLHWIGGHTRGLQVVRVHTARGWVVLASDALHFYANATSGRPFPILVDLSQMASAAGRALALADSGDHLIPGHDPQVLSLFPAFGGVEDVVELSAPPLAPTPLATAKF